ncbi:hypothetical protein LTR56_011225 [Elasticomyces elasticus]|nr:hypothetical protein LTR56_011225 [Elasticomyces elasticus]KAK4921856.1 hypothetical protein LTR49_010795 [Elasticomyces elasticus]KAK5751418.1 hypothetical protein LTS12_018506 [Elasticomyces elasticus]
MRGLSGIPKSTLTLRRRRSAWSPRTPSYPDGTPNQDHNDEIKHLSPGSVELHSGPVVDAAAAYRAQLLGNFLDDYYPNGMPEKAVICVKLQQWFEPQRGKVARAAADSMLLLYAGRAGSDDSIRREGLRQQQVALRLLQDALITLSDPATDESLFGAIDILEVCDKQFFRSNEMDEPYGAHARGLQALILARGPEVFDSSITRDLTLNFLHLPLMISLLARKECVFGRPEWQTKLNSIGQRKGKMYQLAALGCLLPGLFEKADKVLHDANSKFETNTNLLSELVALESQFLDWSVKRYQTQPYSQPYRTVTASDGTLPLDPPIRYSFATTITHNSFLDALAHFNYWALLLMLRETILDIGSLAPEDVLALSPGVAPGKQQQRWKEACAECADSFCQSLPYLLTLPDAQRDVATQAACASLLPLVKPYYIRVGDEAKAEFCSNMISSAQNGRLQTTAKFEDRAKSSRTTRAYLGWCIMAF